MSAVTSGGEKKGMGKIPSVQGPKCARKRAGVLQYLYSLI
jgi:hypothetical protein